jgi:CRISPR-associated endonuclease/helicase Cas3
LTGLLHARFPFWRREALEAQWLQRLGKRGDRLPSVLVSTQIVEQSVDVDADLLITELAPIDMFLQRLGRLWRHDNRRPIGSRPRVILLAERNSLSDFRQMSAVKIKHSLGKKAYVYDPFVLLRSLETLHGRTTICTPNDVRHLIEDAYAERSELPEWAKLYRQLRDKAEDHEQLAKRNSTLWQLLLDDAEHSVQTRLTEVEQIALLLCTERRISGGEIQLKLLDGTAVTLLYGQKQTGGRQPGWLALARAVHRNLVNVPRHWFQESQSSADATGPLPEYVLQPHGLGLVRDGVVVPEGLTVLKALKQRKRICWDENLGIYESP